MLRDNPVSALLSKSSGEHKRPSPSDVLSRDAYTCPCAEVIVDIAFV